MLFRSTDAPQGYYALWSIVNGIPCKWYRECAGINENEYNELNEPNKLRVYPNPSTGSIFISFATLSPVTAGISIYDCSGRLVKNQKSEIRNQKSEVVRLEGLMSGIYFYRVKYQDSEIRGKFTLVR